MAETKGRRGAWRTGGRVRVSLGRQKGIRNPWAWKLFAKIKGEGRCSTLGVQAGYAMR